MTDSNKRPTQISPVLLELVVVTLFLALSCSVVIQLIAKAREISNTATDKSQALFYVEDLMERTKADPAGDGDFDENNIRRIGETHDEIAIDGVVERTSTAGGAMYSITVRAQKDGRELLRLETAAYSPGKKVSG